MRFGQGLRYQQGELGRWLHRCHRRTTSPSPFGKPHRPSHYFTDAEQHASPQNLLRKSFIYNYPYYHSQATGAFRNNDQILRYHVSHCLDILRQTLQCCQETQVFGESWVQDIGGPFPEFNAEHKCMDYEAISEWAEGHQVPLGAVDVGRKREGDVWLDRIP